MQYTHTSSLHLNKKKREKGDGVVPNKTSPSGLLLAFLCVCLESIEMNAYLASVMIAGATDGSIHGRLWRPVPGKKVCLLALFDVCQTARTVLLYSGGRRRTKRLEGRLDFRD